MNVCMKILWTEKSTVDSHEIPKGKVTKTNALAAEALCYGVASHLGSSMAAGAPEVNSGRINIFNSIIRGGQLVKNKVLT